MSHDYPVDKIDEPEGLELSKRRTRNRKANRVFPTGASPKKRRRLERFRKRHPLAHLPKLKSHGPRAGHHAKIIA